MTNLEIARSYLKQSKEIYKEADSFRQELQDFYAFCTYINDVLKKPSKYGLSVE
jgi:hypothetical protein